ncbi:hypothetical protein [Nitrosomonas sp.]|uniref:hypothetical protein n=1 Tax=Nitrosomonas sp. TaxID=42353 RepID=UPI003305D1BA
MVLASALIWTEKPHFELYLPLLDWFPPATAAMTQFIEVASYQDVHNELSFVVALLKHAVLARRHS